MRNLNVIAYAFDEIDESADLHNQVAHSLTLLFILSYTTNWHSFFDDFLAVIQKNTTRGVAIEPFPAQIFLKVLSMIDEEVADALYTATKKAGDQRMNTDIKDRIRAYDVGNVTRFLFQVMTIYQEDSQNEELARMCLMVISQWIGEFATFTLC
jgi:exportin-T